MRIGLVGAFSSPAMIVGDRSKGQSEAAAEVIPKWLLKSFAWGFLICKGFPKSKRPGCLHGVSALARDVRIQSTISQLAWGLRACKGFPISKLRREGESALHRASKNDPREVGF